MKGKWLIILCAAAAVARQPILFPHNRHVALGLACLDCHSTADTRAAASLPSVRKCMLCHEKLATEKPGVQRVREYAARKTEIPWERVYGFEPAALVKFRHAPHYRAKIDCTTCHGDVAKATVAERAVKHTMGTCLDCHRQRNATEDCASCHY
ncbi:MAG: cytochrome c3 family protein [Acidobacteria bacterium]|nr:cytochrome c3 family protein [Acidobacteriota bacterium]